MKSPHDNTLYEPNFGLQRLFDIITRLSDTDKGCPWDIAQTYDSLVTGIIEEAYEVADAVARKQPDELKAELGDLLFQVIFYTHLANKDGLFNFYDVAREVGDKMINRHPHVFGDENRNKTLFQQVTDWENIKIHERNANKQVPQSSLQAIALNLPSLTRAVKLQKRAAAVGFDWTDIAPVIDKIIEEVHELQESLSTMNADKQQEEFGDLLFAMVNLARHMHIDPEKALRYANTKFTRRFETLETRLMARGKTINESDMKEMNIIWDKIKQQE